MRITKTFEIEGYDQTFHVYELKVKQIISLISGDYLDDMSVDGLKKNFSEVFLPMCSNITMEVIEDMAPSELEFIWSKFREANKSFFALAQKMGLEELMEQIKQAIIADFGKIAAPSLKLDTSES